MKIKKAIFLFLALLLPVFVFLFLKMFGRNEFAVAPLYTTVSPDVPAGCAPVSIPYHLPDSIQSSLIKASDSLVIVWFGILSSEGEKQHRRINEAYQNDAIASISIDDARQPYWRKCLFFLKPPYDVALVDSRGLIRGQYVSHDREEIDRLKIEIDIILKKY